MKRLPSPEELSKQVMALYNAGHDFAATAHFDHVFKKMKDEYDKVVGEPSSDKQWYVEFKEQLDSLYTRLDDIDQSEWDALFDGEDEDEPDSQD